MDRTIETRTQELNKRRRRRRRWKNALVAMACVVVFCTTYALILPAITAEAETFCGKEAHEHTDECYEKTLICGKVQGDPSHVHTGDCYETHRVLTCTLAEAPGHTHTDACRQVQQEQICTLTESSGHTHTQACETLREECVCGLEEGETHTHTGECYTQIVEYTCGMEEAPGHTHTGDCFRETVTCTCGMEETPGHTHAESCYSNQEVLVCGVDNHSATDHVHTDACYEKTLICDLEEHTHSESCYSDPDADRETAADWEATLPQQLTGEYTVDVLRMAESQLGYTESTRNYVVTEDEALKGYTRYGDWYGDAYGDWCAMFVSFCLHYAEVEDFPLDANCQSWIQELEIREQLSYQADPENYHRYYVSTAGYEPVPGDVIFFNWDENPDADHVGLVCEFIPATEHSVAGVRTIEGNSGDRVQYVRYDLDDSRIMGYGRLPEQAFYCGKTGHIHDDCGECPLEAHIHDETCLVKPPYVPTEEEQSRIDYVAELIGQLPEVDQIEAELAALEAGEDQDALEAYYLDLSRQALTVWAWYEELDETLQELVPGREKLLSLTWLWEAQTLENTAEQQVYQVNQYKQAVTTIAYGASVKEALGTDMQFLAWDAIVVEADSDGNLYVSQYIQDNSNKQELKAETEDGFVLLLYNTPVDAAEDDLVTVDFDYKTTSPYQASGYGVVSFDGARAGRAANTGLTEVKTADTSKLIEVNLYDYGTNINDKYNSNKNYPGFQQDNGTKGVNSIGQFSMNFGNNITADLAAGNGSVTNQGGAINKTTNGANSPIADAMQSTLGKDGYPALADGTSLSYLFTQNTYATKKNTASVNGLFKYNDTTGAYSFNSRENHAQFDANTNSFVLYDQIITSNFIMYPFGNFLPFNDIRTQATQASTIKRSYFDGIKTDAETKYKAGKGDEYNTLKTAMSDFVTAMDAQKKNTTWGAVECVNTYFEKAGIPKTFTKADLTNIYSIDYDEPTDFYFGMEMKMKFIQPKDGLTGKDTDGNGIPDYPMHFQFTGDDDVWVYVDNKLFLDLSGIHRHVGGEIDFQNGLVKYYALDVQAGDVSKIPYKTVTFAEILGSTEGLNEKGAFEDYTSHTFNFYYMERGAGSGVCRMNFNFPLLHENSIIVGKELSADAELTPILGNPDFRFQVLKANKEELFIGPGVTYQILNQKGEEIGTGVTDENGVFTLKAGQRAVFAGIKENQGEYVVRELLDESDFAQYGTIKVNGTAATKSLNVRVGTEQFTGLQSPVKDMSDGTTLFTFNNQITTKNLGSLEITKSVQSYTRSSTEREFQMEVTLDGALLPVGTPYMVGTETKTVETVGMISLKAGETAVIPNILSGTTFQVRETDASSKGYVVTYQIDGVQQSAPCTGKIKSSTQIKLLVTNQEKGATVTLPVTKTLTNPMPEGAYEYTFSMVQVKPDDPSQTLGAQVTATVTLSGGETKAETAFVLNYVETVLDAQEIQLPATFCYRITEVTDPDNATVDWDESVYMAKVEVKKQEDGTLSAAVTEFYKDNVLQTDGNQTAAFENTLIGSLSLTKNVAGPVNADTEFTFNIHLDGFTGDCTTVIGEETGTLSFDTSGNATVNLKPEQTITLKDIPAGTLWSITEVKAPGYSTSFVVDEGEIQNGETVTGEIVPDGTQVKCINTGGYELPQTGGSGNRIGQIIGLCMLLAAGAALTLRRRRFA